MPADAPIPRCLFVCVRLAFAALCLLAPLAASPDSDARLAFDLPAGDAVSTLRLFATQSGRPLLYSGPAVAGIRTAAVRGTFTAREALARMVTGTSLTVAEDPKSGAFAVVTPRPFSPSTSLPVASSTDARSPPMKKKPLRQVLATLVVHGILSTGSAQNPPPPAEEVVFLDPFRVNAATEDSYAPDEAHTGTIIAVPRAQIPFVTSVMTEGMMRDLGILHAEDISDHISGVSRATAPAIADEGGQSAHSYRVRGFSNGPLWNGFQTGGRLLSPHNIGRIEVSKSPNAVLYGQAAAGGVVNFIPKDPKFSTHAELSVGAGEKGQRNIALDFGGPLGTADASKDGRKAAVRFGASHQEFEREQVFFQSEQSTMFGGMTWWLTPRLSLEMRAEYLKHAVVPSRTAAFVSTGSGPARVVDPYNRLRKDRNFSYNGPYSLDKFSNYLASAHLTYRGSNALTVRVGAFSSEKKTDALVLSGPFGLSQTESAVSRYNRSWGDNRTSALKADALHQATLGGFRVDSLIGFEAHWEEGTGETIATANNIVVSIPFSRRPLATDFPPPPPASAFTVQQSDFRDDLQWTNARFTQFVRSPAERFTLFWGVARGEGDTTTRDLLRGGRSRAEGEKTTSTAGFTARLWERDGGALDRVILFGNSSTSFNIQRGNAQEPGQFNGFPTVEALRAYVATVQPQSISPQEGDGYEVGLRTEWLDRRLSFSATYFDQTNKNIARNFFVRESNVAGVNSEVVIATFQLAGGRENSAGVDLALEWNPTRRFAVTASAQFSQGKVVENPEAPEEVGFGLVSSPENMISVWSRYDFSTEGPLAGLSAGFGFSHNTSTRIRPEIGDRYRLSDDYTRARALLRYTFRTGGYGHTAALHVDNLFDREYTDESNWLSEPRRFRLSYEVSF